MRNCSTPLPHHRGHANINTDTSIADDFAANGYTVVLPDMFAGDKVPLPADRKPGFQLPDWLKDHQPHHVIPIIQKVMGQIRSELSTPPFLSPPGLTPGVGLTPHRTPQNRRGRLLFRRKIRHAASLRRD